jgi:hypothetical protein
MNNQQPFALNLELDTKTATLPDLIATIKNTSETKQHLWTYMLEHRLISGLTARDDRGVDYGFYPFEPSRWAPAGGDEMTTLQPDQEIRVKLRLSKLTGWGFVRTGSQPPILAEAQQQKTFDKGTISAALFPSAAIYTGKKGVHDRTYDRRRHDQPASELEASLTLK